MTHGSLQRNLRTLARASALLLFSALPVIAQDVDPLAKLETKDRFAIDLLIDSSGFPVRMDTTLKAGSTTTPIGLDLARLDPVPAISPPIP